MVHLNIPGEKRVACKKRGAAAMTIDSFNKEPMQYRCTECNTKAKEITIKAKPPY